MLEGRSVSFEYDDNIWPIEHTDRGGERTLESPFPVWVTTSDHRILGVGRLIGAIGGIVDGIPIIEVDDHNAPRGKVQLLGSECEWHPMSEGVLETAEMYPEPISAYYYARQLDASHGTEQN